MSEIIHIYKDRGDWSHEWEAVAEDGKMWGFKATLRQYRKMWGTLHRGVHPDEEKRPIAFGITPDRMRSSQSATTQDGQYRVYWTEKE